MNRFRLAKLAEQVSKGDRTGKTRGGLAIKTATIDNQRIVAIEQNPNTRSEWAQAARRGAKVVQFKDKDTNEYIGVSVDGEVTEY
jgi:hypothetical protein